jgi:hypothetical protein
MVNYFGKNFVEPFLESSPQEEKPFWDVEEIEGFEDILASDGLYYKVWNKGTPKIKQQVAEILAKVRRDLNTLLVYIFRNPDKWHDKPIAFGIFHTFDIHIPCWTDLIDQLLCTKNPLPMINDACVKMGKLFEYQEMTPNPDGILGLNKPKIIVTKKVEVNGKTIDYEIAEKRKIMLTIRNQRTGEIKDYYPTIIDLAIHELTHTTCNDVRWKEDNHMPPYQSYHTMMRQWARECGVLPPK